MDESVIEMARSNRVTKQEAAELMGVSERSIERRKADLQPGVGPAARNGRQLPTYGVAALPVEAQRKYIQSSRVVEMQPSAADSQMVLALTAPVGPNLSVDDRAEAERRYGVIEPLLNPARFGLLYSMYPTMRALIAYLADAHDVKPRTLYHWVSLFRKDGLPGLVNRDRSDKGTARAMNPAAMEYLVALSTGHWTLAEMFRAYCEEREWRAANAGRRMNDVMSVKYARHIDEDGRLRTSAQLPEISRETLRRWFDRVPEFIRVLARHGEDGFHDTQELLSYRDLEALEPLEYVVMDHRRLDIFCLAPSAERGGAWRLIRPWITAAIDMRTRKWLGWVVVESPSSDSIAAVLKKVFVTHGLPQNLYWDNGKDFVCEWFEGKKVATCQKGPVAELDATWRGVLGSLEIRVVHAIPYRARSKTIEPNFGRISKFDQSLPEWCGHKPQARPERFEALVKQHEAWAAGEGGETPFRTIAEIARIYEDAIEDLGEREMENALGMRKVRAGGGYAWMSPNECWDVLIPRVSRRLVPADVLHIVFAKRRTLTVKHSEVAVTFAGQVYHYRMERAVDLARLNGKTVELAYDPLDLEMAAVYYERRFFGFVFCAALRRMGEDLFREDEQARRSLLRETKKFIVAAHQAVPVANAVERLKRRREVTPARVEVPRVEVPIELPGPIGEAVAQAEADRAVTFAAADAEIERVAAPETAADNNFDFFG